MRAARLLVTLILLTLGAAAEAHPGHEGESWLPPTPLREWTVRNTGARITGSFVAANQGQVRLRTSTGAETSVALDHLALADQQWVGERRRELQALNLGQGIVRVSLPAAETEAKKPSMEAPTTARPFQAFKKLKVTWDDRYVYVGSDGLPDHPMMKGIKSWQQQVPLPQPYTGQNSWQIPLHPVKAEQPISARAALFRGAIAVAANGVPIFNALNNRGEDAYLTGELDEWGGHCGRADDYHYHTAPLHLEKVVGKGQPIAYALDGYPIYGLTNPDGTPTGQLDEFNGKEGPDGSYRYHATLKYPYVNGGLRGVVEVRGDQIEPQPRATTIRPALPPLRGAVITDFTSPTPKHFRLQFSYRGESYAVEYSLEADGSYRFTFPDGNGGTYERTYQRGRQPERPPPR